MSTRLSLSLYALTAIAVVAATPAAAAQSKDGVHASTAPLLQGLTAANGLNGGPSPEFNWADGVWNHGEAFGTGPLGQRADTGGFLGKDEGASLILPVDIRDQPYVWTQPGGQPYYRFVNALEPAGTLPQPPIEAAFEVFAPLTWDTSKATVIVLCLYASLPHVDTSFDNRHATPARASRSA